MPMTFLSEDVNAMLSSNINDITAKWENIQKEKALKLNVEENRLLDNPRIFYLASEHQDSANDHKDYQGKIYVDKVENIVPQ